MTRKWKVRILIGFLLMTVLSCCSAYFFIKSAVLEMYGLRTELAKVTTDTASLDSFYITNVNVLNRTGESYLDQHAVGIKDGKIFSVIKEAEIPLDAETIDGGRHYLVPGFTDSHVHLWRSKNDLLLYLANGVTQIREMHGIRPHLKWKSEIEQGRLGPDIYVTASQLASYDVLEGIWVRITAERNVVSSKRNVDRRVKKLKAKGYDSVKASSYLSGEGYHWASEAAQKYDIPLSGHIPLENSLRDLWSSNQKEVAHVEEFVKALNREFGGYNSENATDFLTFVKDKSSEVAQRVLEEKIYVTSTLALIETFTAQQLDIENTLREVELEYVNPGVVEGQAMGWLPKVNRYRMPDIYKTEGWEKRQAIYWAAYGEAQRILFSAFKDKGVPIMAGTDANVPVMVPGFSLHAEMEVMQESGMSTSEVLASATSVPAKWMNWPVGQIREGYEANLVLLREDPLIDIKAARSIEMVFVNGHVLNRDNLDEMLQLVRTANNASRKVSIKPFTQDN